MAVTINKTDSTVLTTIEDGAVDISSTNLSLIGRLYRNYGELINENFVKLLENFANSSAPTTPIVGQLWYNTTTGLMNVYRSGGFISLANLTVSSASPNLPKAGDLWFDTAVAQLKFYSGTAWIIVSPQYSLSQAKTGVFAESILDSINSNHVCVVHYQQNAITAIECRDAEWIPGIAISGFSSVKPGYNLANVAGQQFRGNSSNALALGSVPAASFLRNDINGSIDGSLTLSTDGLLIGPYDDLQLYVDGTTGYISKPDGEITFMAGLNTVLSIDSNVQVKFADGSETSPSISFINDINSGIYSADQNVIGVAINGNTILEISESGLFVNGSFQSNNFGTNLSLANLTVTNNTVTKNLQVQSNTIIGTLSTDVMQIRASNIVIPNGLSFSASTVTFNGLVKLDDSLTSKDGTSPVVIEPTLEVAGNAQVNNNLIVDGTLNVSDLLITDATGRLRLNSSVATAYPNAGDFSMGELNGIRSYNSPKMWIAWNGTLAGLAIYDSFNIDFVTRTSTNNYTFTTEYPITSGAMAVIGSNGTLLAANPSIGAVTFSITTTSENARMALVVLSQ
jgi:hypothetical protein